VLSVRHLSSNTPPQAGRSTPILFAEYGVLVFHTRSDGVRGVWMASSRVIIPDKPCSFSFTAFSYRAQGLGAASFRQGDVKVAIRPQAALAWPWGPSKWTCGTLGRGVRSDAGTYHHRPIVNVRHALILISSPTRTQGVAITVEHATVLGAPSLARLMTLTSSRPF
jgi:hypothetical protein